MDTLLHASPTSSSSSKAKRPCSSSSQNPRLPSHFSQMDHLLHSFLSLADSSPPISLDLSFDRLLESSPSDADQSLLIDRTHNLGSLLLCAANRSARKRASLHNSIAWALPPDLTVKPQFFLIFHRLGPPAWRSIFYVADVKTNIETVQGADVYPAAQQMLIYKGKVLKDETTLAENSVAENSFIVIMLTKNKSSSGEGATASTAPITKAPQASAPPSAPTPASAAPVATSATAAPAPAPAPVTESAPVALSTTASESDVYGQAASNLVAGSNLEGAIQQILDMGGGTWDRDTVVRALRAAYNNPERAVDYLYSGIPEQAEAPPVAHAPVVGQTTNPPAQPQQPPQAAAVPTSGPNANPLNLFPQGLPNMGAGGAGAGTLDFLRNSQQFQALRAMVQTNPQILQPMLQELGKQNPHLMRLIQEHQADFLRLINEPAEGGEGNILGQLAEAMPQAVQITPEERDAIERLEAMGFDRATVLQVFFACNKNEELAANYLLDHMNDLED